MEITDYEIIAEVLRQCVNATNVRILIQDNGLTAQKANIIESSALSLRLQSFTFSNYVLGLDYKDDEYDNFDHLFPNLKNNKSVLTSLMWDDQFYMTQDYQPHPNNTQMNPGMLNNYMNSDPFAALFNQPQPTQPFDYNPQPFNPQFNMTNVPLNGTGGQIPLMSYQDPAMMYGNKML